MDVVAPFFSVIIPAFNREDYLGHTLSSVLSQSFTDFEVVVVDDGSTDRTPAIAASFGDSVRSYGRQMAGNALPAIQP